MVASTAMADMQTFTPERLVAEAQAFSQEAWAYIYDQNYQRLFQFCYLRTGNRDSSEDLASDVFLQALRGIRRYQYRGVPLHAWLYRIASNLIADHLNRPAERRTVPLGDESAHPSLQTPDTADQTAAWHDVRSAMTQLTDDQQQVILLRFFQDLSHEEAAAAMGRRPGAIRALQSRALVALRQLMAQ